jgi:hypothetical protein
MQLVFRDFAVDDPPCTGEIILKPRSADSRSLGTTTTPRVLVAGCRELCSHPDACHFSASTLPGIGLSPQSPLAA